MKISIGNMKTKIMAFVMKVIQTILVNMMKTNIILEKKSNMFLKRLSFGSKDCIEELKLECASFLDQTS